MPSLNLAPSAIASSVFEDFTCSILASQGKVGVLGIRQRRQDSGVEAHQGLQVCRNDRDRNGIHTPERDNIQMAFFGLPGKIARQLPLSPIEWEPPDNSCGSIREKRFRPSQRAKFRLRSGRVDTASFSASACSGRFPAAWMPGRYSRCKTPAQLLSG